MKYRFIPAEGVNPEASGWEKETLLGALHKDNILLLANAWYPGPGFLEKYRILEGKTFACELNLISQGACSPIVFTFQDIDTSDYFEEAH